MYIQIESTQKIRFPTYTLINSLAQFLNFVLWPEKKPELGLSQYLMGTNKTSEPKLDMMSMLEGLSIYNCF